MTHILVCLAAAATAVSSADSGSPGPAAITTGSRYYVLVFGGQGDLLRPTTAHVWAVYVRTECSPDGSVAVDPLTISWLPVSGTVRPLCRYAEPGRNYSLAETMAYMAGPRQRVALWGPYETSECRYLQAARQKATLDCGAVAYKVNDWFDRHDNIDHCMHAVTRAHPDVHPPCRVVRGPGELAAAQVAANMARVGVIPDPGVTHDWLLPALGLDADQFVRRRCGPGPR